MENYGFGRRNGAIDMLRGLTMFLMIFVNDFWTIGDVPHWLEHAATHEDAMGLSDIVFPLFLFVVGLSIPYAIERRFQKLIPAEKTLGHILSRTFALLVMGVFFVNADGRMAPFLGCGDWLFKLLAILGFFLVWNAYPEQFKAGKWLRGAGIILLIALAVTYRTDSGGLMKARWWGILGLIGWAYLFGAVAWLLCRKRTGALSLIWLGLIGLNLLTTATRDGEMLLDGGNLLQDFARALNLGNGSSALMVVTGMLVAVQEKNFGREPAGRKLLYAALSVGILIGFGTAAHEDWIISKNIGTLPWCFYVGAIGITLYTLLRLLEEKGWTGWFAPFRPAGMATLTVYLIPDVYYAAAEALGLESPEWLAGPLGLVKCVAFAFLVIGTAWALGKAGVKIKI
jgi:predicted acyltransferase